MIVSIEHRITRLQILEYLIFQIVDGLELKTQKIILCEHLFSVFYKSIYMDGRSVTLYFNTIYKIRNYKKIIHIEQCGFI